MADADSDSIYRVPPTTYLGVVAAAGIGRGGQVTTGGDGPPGVALGVGVALVLVVSTKGGVVWRSER